MMKKIFLILSVILLVCSCGVKKKTAAPVPQNYELNALLLDAVVEYSKGNIDMAASMFNSVLEQDKNNACAYYYLSNLYFQKQDVAKAVEYGKQAIEKNDNNIWYKLQLSEMYMAVQDYDNAAKLFEKVVKQSPETLEYWQQLARIYYMKQDEKGELATLNKMEERFGVNETFSIPKFAIYSKKKEIKKAEQEIEKLAKAFPNNTMYYSMLAETKIKQKDYDKALEYYNKVREIDPDDENINFTFADYYLKTGNEDSVYTYMSKAIKQTNVETSTKINIMYSVYGEKVDTDSLTFERFFSLLEQMEESGDTTDCRLYMMLNMGYMRKAQYVKAAISGEKAINNGCDGYDLYQNTLLALSVISDPEKMIELADKAIDTYPEQPIPYLFKGVNQEIQEKYSEALETLKSGLSLVGKDLGLKADFCMNIGDCLHSLGQDEECFSYYEIVLEINPENYSVMNNYSYYLAQAGKNLDKAEQMMEKVLKVYPDNYTYLDTYAWVLYKKGDYKKAKETMDKIGGEKKFWENTYKEHYKAIIEKLK